MNLSWDDAAQYTQWLRRQTGRPYRLPTEAEWEYAARSGTTSAYSWGEQVGVAKANCSGCGGSYDPQLPAPVGSFPANPWGLFDMEGGIAEWVEDCWHRNYDGAPANGTAWQAPHCASHVLRGGSWKNPPKDITVSTRNYYDTSVRYLANGARVAMALTGERTEADDLPPSPASGSATPPKARTIGSRQTLAPVTSAAPAPPPGTVVCYDAKADKFVISAGSCPR
jgi:formylglycine-generating enzyme required for sulfatase activity